LCISVYSDELLELGAGLDKVAELTDSEELAKVVRGGTLMRHYSSVFALFHRMD
jgi:hypothetical protein